MGCPHEHPDKGHGLTNRLRADPTSPLINGRANGGWLDSARPQKKPRRSGLSLRGTRCL